LGEVDKLFSAAVSLFNAGDITYSEASLTQILISHPNHCDALQLLGIISDMQGKHEKAVNYFIHALSIRPSASDCWANLGNAHISCCEYADAIRCFKKSIELNENSFEAEYGLGMAYSKFGNFHQALQAFKKSLKLCGENNFQVINGIGITLTQLKQYEEAIGYFKKISNANQAPPEVYCNEGIVYNALKQHSNALASYQKAIALDPNYAQAWYNQGAALHDLGRYDEALASYDRAIEIYPAYAQAWSNKGVTFSCLGDQKRALEFFQKSYSMNPNYGDAGWNLSLIHLLLGNFLDGWKTHESRWVKEDPHPYLHPEYPQLSSLDDIAGKKILVWAEQGYGDTIHFCRFAPLLADLGATVILEVQPALIGLVRSLRNCQIISRGQQALNADYQIPLLSLPALFDIEPNSIPDDIPYLQVSDAKLDEWRQRLQLSSDKLNIGFACSGNMHHQNDVNRSMPLSAFAPLLADERFNLFLVQKELREEDRLFYEQSGNIQFLGPNIDNFEDSAAVVQNLDIIISVDTSLVHLAGALGKEVLVLLPRVGEWRWLVDRTDSPWYPTATLIRQPSPGNWSAVIEAVGKLLSKKELGV
jgi:tetratricopeptide (TPR) repeat protein